MTEDIKNYSPTVMFRGTPCFSNPGSCLGMKLFLLVLQFSLCLPDPERDDRGGFRERIQCIENGKFYRKIPTKILIK